MNLETAAVREPQAMTEQVRRSNGLQDKYGSVIGKPSEAETDFEEALILAGTGRFHHVLLAVSGLCMMTVMIEVFSTSFLLPSAQCDFKFSSEEKGILNSICMIGMLCSCHMWGFLADTRGRRKVILIALFADSIITIISAFAPTFWLFLLLRFLNGFFIIAPGTVLYAYLGEFHPVHTRSKAITWVCVFIGVGIAVQPCIAWIVLPQPWSFELPWYTFNSWRIFVILCAVPGLLSAIFLLLWFPESPKFLMVLDKKEEALKVLCDIYARNTGNSPQRFPVKSLVLKEDGSSNPVLEFNSSILGVLKHMWHQTVPLFLPPLLLKTLLVCVIQFGLYASANGLSLWLPDIFNHLAEFSVLYPESPGSVCQAYSVPANNNTRETIFNNKIELPLNDTVNFTCDNDSVVLQYNNKIMPFSDDSNVIQCINGSLLKPINSDILLFNVINGSATVELVNDSMRNLISTETTECNSDVDFSVFQNTIILGVASAVSLVIVGYLIGPLSKKTIIVVNLVVGGIVGCLLDYVYSVWEVTLVAGIFVVLSGMCIGLLVSIVVENFPTHLRAMAVCLSLMIGRLGSICINVLMGVLLELNCPLMIFIMGGICIGCGLLGILLPSSKKT